jgi:sugar phosphate isomerase/epimerase
MDVAIRDAMLPSLDGTDFFRGLRDVGVSSIEIEVQPDFTTPNLRQEDGRPFSVKDAGATAGLKRRLADEGVRSCALLLCTDFYGADAEAHVEYAVRAAQAAREVGAPVIRIDPLNRDKDLGEGEVLVTFVRKLDALARRTRDTGVDLGIENHGPFGNDPRFLDHVFAATRDDPRVGLTLDTGNFYWFGHPLAEVYKLVQRFTPRAKHTHVKSINYPPALADVRRPVGHEYGKHCCPLDEGNLDLKKIVGVLRTGGYARDLCIENEALGKYPPEQRVNVMRRDVKALRDAIGAEKKPNPPAAAAAQTPPATA